MCSSPILEPPNSPGTLLRGCQPLLLLRRDLSHVLLVDLTAPATRLAVDGVLPQAVAKRPKFGEKNQGFPICEVNLIIVGPFKLKTKANAEQLQNVLCWIGI